MLESAPGEKETWLLGQGLPLKSDLSEVLHANGISLLLAYALNLDLKRPERGLPVTIVEGETIVMSFYGARRGISHAAQSSSDLRTWTSDGVTLTDPGPDGRRTASVFRRDGKLFLRVIVTQE